MSRFPLATPQVDNLSLDVSDDMLRSLPHKEPSEAGSSTSSYSPYAFRADLKPDDSIRSPDDKDGSAFANSLIAQSLNADGTPKRPMNAFMIFARKRRPEVSAANQMMRTGEISKILSKEWNAMDITQKQFYLDQAKRLKDTFNSKYPDYVYRRRPNNSRKKRRTDPGALSPPEADDMSGGDPSPIEGEELDDHPHVQYPFNNQDLSPGLDELFTHSPNSSTLPSHGSYSSYPYPHSSTHRTHHLSHHQQHQQHQHEFAHPPPRSALSGSLSFPHPTSMHSQSALRSAPPHDYSSPSLFPNQSSPSLSGSGNGFLLNNSSQSQHSNYWGSYHDRESANSPHRNTSSAGSSSSSNATTLGPSIPGPWLPPPIPNSSHQYGPPAGRERSYTTTALPAMKSSFPHSPGVDQMQLPLPPMMTSNGNSSANGLRRPMSGGHNSHNGTHYVPSYFPSQSSNGALGSPSASPASGRGGYFPSPPSTTSSTSTGNAGGGDRLLTPPELSSFDLGRHGHAGENTIVDGVYEGWAGRK